MKKKWFIAGCAGIFAALLGGCNMMNDMFSKLRPAEVLTGIVDFSYSYTSGSYMNSGNSYEAKLQDDGSVLVKIRSDTQAEAREFTAGPEFLDKLTSIANECEVSRWDGFSGNDKNVLDGDSFHFYLGTDSGQSVSCSGYMKWPDGYAGMRTAVEPMFIGLFPGGLQADEGGSREYRRCLRGRVYSECRVDD